MATSAASRMHHGKKQKRRKNNEMHDALEHGRPAGAQRNHADNKRQCQKYLLLGVQPELKGLLKHD